jgi:NAD(P)-dependent dehydrogenase (short-subunit alcohol dehydrogenase family)
MPYWQGKVGIVTGGSSGLGFSIAQALARQQIRVVIAARGREALETAAERLKAFGAEVLACPTDVTCQEQVETLVGQTIDRFGRIDLLVNNAGRSARGRAIDTTPEEFERLWELNVLSAVRTTRAAAPHLLAARGHLVNIGSLAGKAAAPWMGAYAATKFALSAYTAQLRLELADRGLHVLLVSPGPIARDQPREYAAAGHDVPASARRPGAGVRLRAIDPNWLAERILRACQRRQAELVVPGGARLLFAISQLAPGVGDWLLRRAMSGGS